MLGIIQEHRGAESEPEEIQYFSCRLSICLSSSWESKVVLYSIVSCFLFNNIFLLLNIKDMSL